MLRLDSVGAKIERANEHARLLGQELDAWIKEKPYAVAKNANSHFTRHSVVVSVLKPPPLQQWSLLLGDAIHNMRSALDHLVYAISVHELRADPPPNGRTCAFPITDKAEYFRPNRFGIDDLSRPVQCALESVQPYSRKHPVMPPLLALLRDFDDADKHRLIKVVLQRSTATEITVTGPMMQLAGHRFESCHVNLVDGAEVAWVTTPHPTLLLEDLLPEVIEVIGIVSAAVVA